MDTEPLRYKNSKLTVYYDPKKDKVLAEGALEDRRIFLPQDEKIAFEDHTWQGALAAKLRIRNEYVRFFLAEMLGTFLLIVFGVGCVAQAVLNRTNIRLNVIAMNLGWGCGVAIAFVVCGGVTGGHINPSVTVCFALLGRIKWRHVPAYVAGQYIGAFLGSLAVYIVYYNQLNAFDGGVRQGPYTTNAVSPTAGIWATYPQNDNIKTWQCFIDQVFGTGLLVLSILAVIDKCNMEIQKGVMPIIIAFIVMAIGTSYESNCGAALNPARDFSARLFTALFGWGSEVFSFRNYNWFWVPMLGPHIGAILGAWLYNICVGLHFPPATAK